MPSLPAPQRPAFDAVVVAASLGGLDVLEQLLAPLPADFPAPILVAQHLDERSPGYLPVLLARRTALAVRHATDGAVPLAGTVLVAPPGRHLLVGAGGRCALSDAPRVSFARPSADLLFRSAAAHHGARTLGVVLTGRLQDGAAGAVAIRAAGGAVLAQDPATCRADGMPTAVIRSGAAHFVLPPSGLAAALVALVAVPGGATLFGVRGRTAA